jgi:hypothetical protein
MKQILREKKNKTKTSEFLSIRIRKERRIMLMSIELLVFISNMPSMSELKFEVFFSTFYVNLHFPNFLFIDKQNRAS